jgi:hypothetical protein
MTDIASTSGSLHSEFVIFYSEKLQGHRTRKLTAFLHLQGFNLHNQTVVSSTTSVWCSPHRSKGKWATSSTRLKNYGSLNIDGVPIASKTHSPITLPNLSSINLISIFRYSSPCVRAHETQPNSLSKGAFWGSPQNSWTCSFKNADAHDGPGRA